MNENAKKRLDRQRLPFTKFGPEKADYGAKGWDGTFRMTFRVAQFRAAGQCGARIVRT